MRSVVVVVVAMFAGTANAEVCETLTGTSIASAEVSTAGTFPLAIMRTADPDDLIAVNPAGTRTLSISGSKFALAASASSHLLVTSDSEHQAPIMGQRFTARGAPDLARIEIMPAEMRDLHVEAVLFDDRDFIVIVQHGTFANAESWKVVVTTDGKVREPVPFVLPQGARVFPGPTPGTLWVVETIGQRVARVRGADGVDGPAVDLGFDSVLDAATGANGDLLVLQHAGDDVIARVVTPDGRQTTAATGAGRISFFTFATARPEGGYLLVSGDTQGIVGLVLDAGGSPVGAPAEWARGFIRDVSYGHIAWTQSIESATKQTNQLVVMPLSPNGPSGVGLPLASTQQDREVHECASYGCADAGGGGAGMLVLLLVLMYVSRDVRARRQLRRAS